MIDAVDVNKNGEVEFEEFCVILKKQRGKNVYAASLDLAMIFGAKEIENLRRQFIKVRNDSYCLQYIYIYIDVCVCLSTVVGYRWVWFY